MTDDKIIPEDEYRTWMEPSMAIKRLKEFLPGNNPQSEMLDRLCADRLHAAARSTNWNYKGRSENREYERLSYVLWASSPPPEHYDLLWKTGSHTFQTRDTEYGQKWPTKCYGIRFDPADIRQIFIDAGVLFTPDNAELDLPLSQDRERKTRHGLPALPDPRLIEWHALFLRAYPNGSKSLAERSAFGMFPDHSIDRQKVRDLFPHAKSGRPFKIND